MLNLLQNLVRDFHSFGDHWGARRLNKSNFLFFIPLRNTSLQYSWTENNLLDPKMSRIMKIDDASTFVNYTNPTK